MTSSHTPSMEACNLDKVGVRKRLVLGIAFLVLGLAFSLWFIANGRPVLLRALVALPCFLIASFSLFQAQAKT